MSMLNSICLPLCQPQKIKLILIPLIIHTIHAPCLHVYAGADARMHPLHQNTYTIFKSHVNEALGT